MSSSLENSSELEAEIQGLKAQNAPVPVTSQPDLSANPTVGVEKRGRGRPKGSTNKVKFAESQTVNSSSIATNPQGSNEVMQKISPAQAQGFIGLISGMFIVMRLEPVTAEEKQGFVEVWSNVELPFSADSKYMKYLPLIAAGMFTLGLFIPRLDKLKKDRKASAKETENKKQSIPQISKENNVTDDNTEPIPSVQAPAPSVAKDDSTSVTQPLNMSLPLTAMYM